MKYIVASHVGLAKGYKEILDFFVPGKDITAICCYDNFSFEKDVRDFFSEVSEIEPIVVFTDLLAGYDTRVFIQYIKNRPLYLIASVNVEVMIEIVSNDKEDDMENVIETAIHNAKENISFVNDEIRE